METYTVRVKPGWTLRLIEAAAIEFYRRETGHFGRVIGSAVLGDVAFVDVVRWGR